MTKNIIIAVGVLLVLFLGINYFNNSSKNTDNTDNSVSITTNNTDNIQVFTLEIVSSDNSITNYQVTFEPGSKLSEILNKFSQTNSDFTFETDKSDFGEFITKINGISADSTKEFWNIKSNGIDSSVGISDFTPQNNDIISFNLLKF